MSLKPKLTTICRAMLVTCSNQIPDSHTARALLDVNAPGLIIRNIMPMIGSSALLRSMMREEVRQHTCCRSEEAPVVTSASPKMISSDRAATERADDARKDLLLAD